MSGYFFWSYDTAGLELKWEKLGNKMLESIEKGENADYNDYAEFQLGEQFDENGEQILDHAGRKVYVAGILMEMQIVKRLH